MLDVIAFLRLHCSYEFLAVSVMMLSSQVQYITWWYFDAVGNLFCRNHLAILGENNQNLPKIMDIIATAFQHEAVPIKSDVGTRMVNIVRQLQVSNLPLSSTPVLFKQPSSTCIFIHFCLQCAVVGRDFCLPHYAELSWDLVCFLLLIQGIELTIDTVLSFKNISKLHLSHWLSNIWLSNSGMHNQMTWPANVLYSAS